MSIIRVDNISALPEPVPAENSLNLNSFPNPFSGSTQITMDLTHETEVTLSVYTIGGQLVNHLIVNETRPAGSYTVDWLCDRGGAQQVRAGVYICIMTTSEGRGTIKMVKLDEE